MAAIFAGRTAVRIIVTAVAVIDHAAMIKLGAIEIHGVMAVIAGVTAGDVQAAFTGVDGVVMATDATCLQHIAVIHIGNNGPAGRDMAAFTGFGGIHVIACLASGFYPFMTAGAVVCGAGMVENTIVKMGVVGMTVFALFAGGNMLRVFAGGNFFIMAAVAITDHSIMGVEIDFPPVHAGFAMALFTVIGAVGMARVFAQCSNHAGTVMATITITRG